MSRELIIWVSVDDENFNTLLISGIYFNTYLFFPKHFMGLLKLLPVSADHDHENAMFTKPAGNG